MTWPTHSSTTAILEEAARRLGAAAYERAWQDGAGLQLADINRAATGERLQLGFKSDLNLQNKLGAAGLPYVEPSGS